MNVLVTGATGYIGGRLIPRLLERGHVVRVLVRDPGRIQEREWSGRVEVRQGDLHRPDTLASALDGVDAAYYLVHSMCAGKDFAELDRTAALNFANAASGLRQVIYLGGIAPDSGGAGKAPSAHLSSREEVGRILREHLPTTEIRAGPIIGSGSASFEMVRYLTERLPAMIAPKWILNPVRPIGISDILSYLLASLGNASSEGVIDVGLEPLTFKSMMKIYAEVRGLPRWIVPVPVLAPSLAARWVGLVTPIPNCLAVPLVEGVVRPVVGDTSRAEELFPEIRPIPYREAVKRALDRTEASRVATRWSGALGGVRTYELEDREGLIREVRTRFVQAAPQQVFDTFTGLGGERGWLVWGWLWRIRGFIDKLFGGPGLRRGRRDPNRVLKGEAIDFWRVEDVRAPELLRLRAEMKVPGRAWLQWEAAPEGEGTRLVQTALFYPTGFWGLAYWYGIYPLHAKIFSDMVNAIARRAAERGVEGRASDA